MDAMGKAAAVALIAALCAAVVKRETREIGLVLSLTAGAVIVSLVLAQVSGLGTFLESLADAAGLAPAVFAPVLKTVGISILTRISSELCRDAGEWGLAAFVEMAGAALALLVTAPLLQAVLDTLSGLL